MSGWAVMWARRLPVMATYVAMFAALAILFVPLAVVAASLDLRWSQPWTLTRTLVFFLWYLACELAGVAASLAIWLASLLVPGFGRESFLAQNFALQHWWARMLGRGGFRIFDIRLELDDGGYRFGQRPVLLFVRHASTADTILAALAISVPHGTRLRYVLKRELLWDPCLDIVGNRLPNAFVHRDEAHTADDVAMVASLARGLGPRDGVLIYPEGSRFSPAKKDRIVARLREQGREEAAREAESLRHVLRPRSGGPLALLEAAPDADVLFLAHTGFEGSASFDRFFNGGLIHRTVHARIRAVRAEDVPKDEAARREWMMAEWRLVDDFVNQHRLPDLEGKS